MNCIYWTKAVLSAPDGKDTDDDDMGLVGAEADDAEAEFIRKVCEKVRRASF
jgi:hypothetical protein